MIGTHNSFTYRRPKNIFTVPFYWIGRCQRVDYKTLVEAYGAKALDMRIYFKGNDIEFRHGGFAYDASDIWDILKYCNDHKLILRIMLESRSKRMQKEVETKGYEERFFDLCKYIEAAYPDIKLYSGRNVFTWRTIYHFKNDYEEVGLYSSVTNLGKKGWMKKLDDWCPWFYARLKNESNRKEYELYDDRIIQFDFIDI